MIGNGGDRSTPRPGEVLINKWGLNNDIDTGDANGTTTSQVIWPVKSTTQNYLFIDAAIQLYVKSSSGNDIITGNGAQKVKITNWHGADGNIADPVELDMNGTTNVALPQTSYGVFSFSVIQSGATKKNEGTIDIVDISGNIYARINVGESRTQIAVQRIPNNKKACLSYYRIDYSRVKSTINSAVMRIKERLANKTEVTRVDPTISTEKVQDSRTYEKDFLCFSPGSWVYVLCTEVTANNTPVRAEFDLLLENIT